MLKNNLQIWGIDSTIAAQVLLTHFSPWCLSETCALPLTYTQVLRQQPHPIIGQDESHCREAKDRKRHLQNVYCKKKQKKKDGDIKNNQSELGILGGQRLQLKPKEIWVKKKLNNVLVVINQF